MFIDSCLTHRTNLIRILACDPQMLKNFKVQTKFCGDALGNSSITANGPWMTPFTKWSKFALTWQAFCSPGPWWSNSCSPKAPSKAKVSAKIRRQRARANCHAQLGALKCWKMDTKRLFAWNIKLKAVQTLEPVALNMYVPFWSRMGPFAVSVIVLVTTKRPRLEGAQHDVDMQREISLVPSADSEHASVKQIQLPLPISTSTFLRHISFTGPRIFLDLCQGPSIALSSALQSFGYSCLAVDASNSQDMNLLHDFFYEDVLRLGASGLVGYCVASPLALEPLLRSQGPELETTKTSLRRTVQCLEHVVTSGGHGHLEASPSALIWCEPKVRHWLRTSASICVIVAACHHGAHVKKHWMFASSFEDLEVLASCCNHEHHLPSDDSDEGLTHHQGDAYPVSLAMKFAELVAPFLNLEDVGNSIASALQFVPTKGLLEPPHSLHDGGGRPSKADWSFPPQVDDVFQGLRHAWINLILKHHLHKQFQVHLRRSDPDPPFSDAILDEFREALANILPVSWNVREHQPMCLQAMKALSAFENDPDTALFDSLLEGVSAGVSSDPILPSNVFWPVQRPLPADEAPTLQAHLQNWKSSEDHPDLTAELLQTELEQGGIFRYDGDLSQAQLDFPTGVALGKLGIAFSDARPPRLILDSSVCQTNQNCEIPEKQCYPSARDVLDSFPLRGPNCTQQAATFDVKSAHKRVVLKEGHRGLVGFQFRNNLYFYRVCPFGASFSAFWWGRLGSWLIRTWHKLLWVRHSLYLFVDDFLLTLPAEVLPLYATLLAIFARVFKIPLSWRKCTMGSEVDWIGWRFNFTTGVASLHPEKHAKLLDQISQLLSHSKCTKKQLEKFPGLALWVTQLFLPMRSLLHWVFADLHTCAATHYSVNPGFWPQVMDCLSAELCFVRQPPGTAIPLNSKLVSARHVDVSSLDEVRSVAVSDRRLWLRMRNPSSQSRKLSAGTKRVLKLFQAWLMYDVPKRSMRPLFQLPVQASADASASGVSFQIGGCIHIGSYVAWFAETWTVAQIKEFGMPMNSDAQRDISSYETLAQMALIFVSHRILPSKRLPIRLPTQSDNVSAEAGGNKFFSTASPLCVFLEKLALLSVHHGITPDVSHIAGELNASADLLSRWDFEAPLPLEFDHSSRIRLQLDDLLRSHRSVRLVPSDFTVPWDFPWLNKGICFTKDF